MADNPEPKRIKTEIDDGDGDTSSHIRCCGICLLDDGAGAAIRGEIDSCDHFFCFVCIMEWAKIESLCPLCKRRFGSIRRPPVAGVFAAQRVVKVPVRDQVYHLSGNATIGPRDPYSNIRCSVCDTVGDENLLLLCDLCDSASHTHCVGLGGTVPEGDWFCHDCTISKAEHVKIEADEDCNIKIEKIETDEDCNIKIEPIELSIDEIVRESRLREVNPRERIIEGGNSERNPSVATSASNFGARTLKHSRNVHARVRALRENWNALRSGSVNFTSSSNDLHTNRGERANRSCVTSSSQQNASGSSYEVEKAWKMMNKAKSIIQTHEKNKINNQKPKHLLSKINNPFDEARPKSLLVLSNSSSCGPKKHHSFCSCSNGNNKHKSQVLAKQNRGAESSSRASYHGEKHKTRINPFLSENKLTSRAITNQDSPSSRKFSTLDRDDSCEIGGKSLQKHSHVSPSITIRRCEDHKSNPQLSSKRELGVDSTLIEPCLSDNKLTSDSITGHESPFSRKSYTWVSDDFCEIGVKLLQKNSSVLPSITITSGEDHKCFPSPPGTFFGTSRTYSIKLDGSSSSKMDLPKRESPVGENIIEHKASENDPKSDIQVLVKLNLKLLSRERKLDVKVFKEIARLATHSIMAACGLEQPKPGVRTFPTSVCWHTNQDQNQNNRRKSTLMPNCCRECFHIFVKDVVNSIMVEKISSS